MCGAQIFPQILRIAGVPQTLHARTDENDAVTLGSIFADRPEAEFLHAVAVFERFEAGTPGAVTRDTTIGELRAVTRQNIIDGTVDMLSHHGVPPERTRAFLATYAMANP